MPYKILDLFCGAGGSAVGLYNAGFWLYGVDNKPQPNYPFEFILVDALTYPLHGYDAYWASPPCQKFSAMQHIHNNRYEHPDLIEPIRKRLAETDKPYIIENVVGAPIRTDLMLCGTMFGLRIPRHRIFESNIVILPPRARCNHKDMYDPYHGGEMARGEREKLSNVLGIDWFMTRPEVREAIPPAYSEHIGNFILRALQ